jgi:histidyl-tRNA synthetase
MKYAVKLGVNLVIMLGQDELEKGYYTVRNMKTGEQFKLDDQNLITDIRKLVL